MASSAATSAKRSLPVSMKAAVSTGFGDMDKNIQIDTSRPAPSSPSKGEMIIRVLACALAPGDVRLFYGFADYFQMPPGGHPYIIGSDVSGIVEQVDVEHEIKFKVGDYVVCRFEEPKPHGGVAEYRLVKTSLSEKCPLSIDPLVACGLPASAMAAKRIARQFVFPDARVLVLGGSGAVGSSVIQYTRNYGAAFVVAVSTQEELCRQLGADEVIDYRKTNWWEVKEYQNSPFDIIFDMVNGENWNRGIVGASRKGKLAMRKDGDYVCLMTGVETKMVAHGPWTAFITILELLRRLLHSKLNPQIPEWKVPEALKLEEGDLEELFEDVASNKLKPLMDEASPFKFNEQGVRDAMKLQESKHAHGKVVVMICDDKSK